MEKSIDTSINQSHHDRKYLKWNPERQTSSTMEPRLYEILVTRQNSRKAFAINYSHM